MLRLVVPSPDGVLVHTRLPRRMVACDAEHEQVIEELVGARLVTSTTAYWCWRTRRSPGPGRASSSGWRRTPRVSGSCATSRAPRTPGSRWAGRTASSTAGAGSPGPSSGTSATRPKPSAVEEAFLDASTALANAELEAARERAGSGGRARRRTRRLAGGLAVALALAVVAATTATYFQRSASERADEAAAATVEADANRLAALSRSVGSLDLSLLLAAQAARHGEHRGHPGRAAGHARAAPPGDPGRATGRTGRRCRAGRRRPA